LTDLGSTSVTADADGTFQSETKYTAFGETHSSTGATHTDYLYTGQRLEAEIGLYFYNARFYDATLGRFTQADTIIPGAGNVLTLDRYAYTLNNPLRYNDPSGHYYMEDPDGGRYTPPPSTEVLLARYGVTLADDWNTKDKLQALRGIQAIDSRFRSVGGSFREAYGTNGRPIILQMGLSTENYYVYGICATIAAGGCSIGISKDKKTGGQVLLIVFMSLQGYSSDPIRDAMRRRNNIVHEFGHLFNTVMDGTPYDAVSADWDTLKQKDDLRSNQGFGSALNVRDWVMNSENVNYEVFADQFLGWVFNKWETGPGGNLTEDAITRSNWMNSNMSKWLSP